MTHRDPLEKPIWETFPEEDNIRLDQSPTFPPVVLLGTSHHLTSAYTSLEDILCGY